MRSTYFHNIYITLVILSLCITVCSAQSDIDSLLSEINQTINDSSKIIIYHKIAGKYASPYANYSNAIKYSNKALELAKHTGNAKGETDA